jgi:hypothetical protein
MLLVRQVRARPFVPMRADRTVPQQGIGQPANWGTTVQRPEPDW